MITAESITAALKKLGPVSPGELADHLEVAQSALGYHLKKMLEAGTIKASGVTKGRRIHLPDQKVDATPTPPQRRAGKKRKGKKRAARTPRTPAERTPAAAPTFIAAVTADKHLVIFDGGTAPQIFNGEKSSEIATVLAQHYGE